jgi:exodeoxyribonuclease VII small subunit
MVSHSQKTYSELTQEFEVVMSSLQSGTVDVDEAVKLYEQGLLLTTELEKRLEAAENKVIKLQANLEN